MVGIMGQAIAAATHFIIMVISAHRLMAEVAEAAVAATSVTG